MGVCFLVMFPVLYTDVTDAWRLGSRRKRLMIGAAGVAVELAVACFATLAWAFLDDGPARSVAFTMATVGWVISLAINLNPLMRFDGYYLFSDAIGVENLQARAFEYGRWRLREILFDLRRPAPERLPASTETILIYYAWATWLYRLVVFTGIALLVYYMAFKLLGIALFLIEIVYFILRPIWNELSAWRGQGRAILSTRRARITCGLAACMFLAAVTPWSKRITVPAVLETAELTRVFPQRPGFVESVFVRAGDRVNAGQVLVKLSSLELSHRLSVALRKRAAISVRLGRRGADATDRRDSLTMEEELRSLNSEITGLHREAQELEIRAPIGGEVAEFNADVHRGRAIGGNEFIALIRGGSNVVARGYLSERDVPRVGVGAAGKFIAEGIGFRSVPVRLKSVAEAGAQSVDIPELASTHGGLVAVRPARSGANQRRLAPVEAIYLVTLEAPDSAQASFAVRGVVSLNGAPRSFAGTALRRVAAVLVRESGF
jgi:putative peptide zinc metalloprotease protein